MPKFSFDERTTEEEGLSDVEDGDFVNGGTGGRTGGSRRILVIAGIGVILIGGFYLANRLFLPPPPPPTPPAAPLLPPAVTAPVPAPAAAPAPPAKEMAKPEASIPPGQAPAPASPGPKKAPTPEKTAEGPAPAKTDPGKAAPAKPGDKLASKSAPAPPGWYSLQLGAMVLPENAEALKRKLETNGFPAAVRKGAAFVSKQLVTVGEPTGRREAEELSRRLNVDGFPSELVAVEGRFTPQIGAFFNLDEAIDLARELQKKNYVPKITAKQANTVVYQVRHGKFNSRAEAVRRGEELRSKGYSFMVVRD